MNKTFVRAINARTSKIWPSSRYGPSRAGGRSRSISHRPKACCCINTHYVEIVDPFLDNSDVQFTINAKLMRPIEELRIVMPESNDIFSSDKFVFFPRALHR